MKKILTTITLLLPITAYAADEIINLDGVKLCVPEKYAPPSALYSIGSDKKSSTNLYKDLFVQFSAAELKKAIPRYKPDTFIIEGKRRYTPKGVTIANVKTITAKSLVQEQIIELIKTKRARFKYMPKLKLYAIRHDATSLDFSLLRSKKLPKSLDTKSLHNWIVAYCETRKKENRYECNFRRIVNNLVYDVTIPNHNMMNRKSIEKFIDKKLIRWKKACKK